MHIIRLVLLCVSAKNKNIEKEIKVSKEKDKALGENKKIIFEYARTLKESGKSTEEIQKLTNLSKKEIVSL